MNGSSQPRLRAWGELCSPDFDAFDATRTVAVLPVSAVEQHGPHLPLATDAILLDAILERAAAALDRADIPHVLTLPPQVIGHSLEHTAFPGTLHVDVEPLLAAWTSLGAAVARAGVRKLAIVNAHGGQPQLVDLAALRLRREHDMLVARVQTFTLGFPVGLFTSDELRHGLHGGEVETSMMLSCRPDLVRMEQAQDFASRGRDAAKRFRLLEPEGTVGFAWAAEDLHPSGATGDASAADAVRGAAALEYIGARVADVLHDLVVANPNDVLHGRGGR